MKVVAEDALARLLVPSLEREVRRELTEHAQEHAVSVFARNLRSLLLQPPLRGRRVLAIDPGFRTGCKIAALDETGNLLEQSVIFPHPPQNKKDEAKVKIAELVSKHQSQCGCDRQRHRLPRDGGSRFRSDPGLVRRAGKGRYSAAAETCSSAT